VHDLLVVGGGPVGLVTAIEAAQAGLSVAVLEPRAAPRDKACGEGLMPSAVAALARLGVDPPGRAFDGIAYRDGNGRYARALFRAGPGRGVRRTTLSAVLAGRAEAVGVTWIDRRADEIEQGDGWVGTGGLRGCWLVAADGLASGVRHGLGLDVPVRSRPRYGLRRHYHLAPWDDVVEVHWARDAEAYVTPVADDLVGVAVLCPGGEPYEAWLTRFPELRERLARARPASAVRGSGRLRRKAAAHVAGRVLLVGDAGGYVDALTGEGLAVGFAEAREAVRCLVAGRPERYERAWHRITRRYRLTAGGLLAVTGVPVVRRALVPTAAALPPVFSGIVNHLG